MDWKKLLEEFATSFSEALTAAGDDKEKRAAILAEATNELPKEARQFLSDVGFASGYAKLQAAETAHKTEKEALTKQIADLKAAADKGGTGGDDALRKRITDLEAELAKKDSDYASKLEAIKAERTAERVDAFKERAMTRLLNEHKVDPFIARAALLDPAVAGRIAAEEVDGKPVVRVYVDANRVQPLTLKSGQAPEDALAEEIAAGIDARYKGSGVRGGAGVQNGGGNTPTGVEKAIEAAKKIHSGEGRSPLSGRKPVAVN